MGRTGESGLVPGYFNCTCNICEGALTLYYAGPWGQKQQTIIGLVKEIEDPPEPGKWWMRVMKQWDALRRGRGIPRPLLYVIARSV